MGINCRPTYWYIMIVNTGLIQTCDRSLTEGPVEGYILYGRIYL